MTPRQELALERAHCDRISGVKPGRVTMLRSDVVSALLLQERAAVREECEAKHARLVEAGRRLDSWFDESMDWDKLLDLVKTFREVLANEPPAEPTYSTAAVDALLDTLDRYFGATRATVGRAMDHMRASKGAK